jgi:hypothetical protein
VRVPGGDRGLEDAARDVDPELGGGGLLALEHDVEVLAHRDPQRLGEVEPQHVAGVARERRRDRQELRRHVRGLRRIRRCPGVRENPQQDQHGETANTWHVARIYLKGTW